MGFLFRSRAAVTALTACLLVLHARAADKLDFVTQVLGNVDPDKPILVVRVSSPNGCHVALLCKGTNPGTSSVLVDGINGPEFHGILSRTPLFSPDSRRVVYGARIDEKWIVFEPGKSDPIKCPKWTRVLETGFAFSSDSQHMAYVAKRDKWYVVADDIEHGPYDDVTSLPIFSKDGKRMIYGVKQNGKQMIIDQGEAGPVYDFVGAAAVSGDGKRIAYAAQKEGRQFVAADGQHSPAYGGVYGESLQFSPDGNRLAYAAERGIARFVVIDGEVGPQFESIVGNSLRFSPDSKRVGYIVRSADEWRAVVDGKPGSVYSKIERLLFSADSQHFAYAAGDETSRFVVIDGEKGPEYTEIVKDSLVFNSTGASIAYCAVQENKKTAVIFNGKKMGEYDAVGVLCFSPDGCHLTYRANAGEGLAVYLDGKLVFGPAALVAEPAFHGDGTLEFITLDQKALCRITAKPF